MSEGNGSVNYTVKELIARLDGKIDSVLSTLANKADKVVMENLDRRLTNIETSGSPHITAVNQRIDRAQTQIEQLTRYNDANKAVRATYKWIIGLVIGSLATWATLALKLFGVI